MVRDASRSRERKRGKRPASPVHIGPYSDGTKPQAFEITLIEEEVTRKVDALVETSFQEKLQTSDFQERLFERLAETRDILAGKMRLALEEEEARLLVLRRRADEAEARKGSDIAALGAKFRAMQQERLKEMQQNNSVEVEQKRFQKRGRPMREPTVTQPTSIPDAIEAMNASVQSSVGGQCVDYLERFRQLANQ